MTDSATLLEGVIHYAIPGTYTYRVILDGDLGELICGDMHNVSFNRSVRILQVYSVGTRVLVLKHHGLLKGMIIGSPAREVLDTQYEQSVLSSAIGRFHIANRQYVKNVVKNPDTGRGIPSYTQGRAVDVCEGDYMVTNMAEGGFFTSPHETSVRQSHDCGVWMFSMDRLLRLIGRSVQEYSLAHERYAGMDEHETYGYEGTALLPWEALGYFGKPDDLWKKNKGTEVVGGKGISFMEPKEDKAEPFYRHQVFTGWIGQGFTREMRIPPKNIDAAEAALRQRYFELAKKVMNDRDGRPSVEASEPKPIRFSEDVGPKVGLEVPEKSAPVKTTPKTFSNETWPPLDSSGPKQSFSPAEAIEVEKIIQTMDETVREAFVLHFAARKSLAEIAAVQNLSEDRTFRRIEEAFSVLQNGVDYLIVGVLLRRARYPDARRLTATETATAKSAWRCIPRKCRKIYRMFKAEYRWKHEIAGMLGKSVEEVERRIDEADGAIRMRYVELAKTVVQDTRDGKPTAARYPERPATPPKKAVHSQRRNLLGRVLAGIGLLFTQMGASSPGKAAGAVAVPVLATLAAPFLWVMSLLITA